MGLNVALFSIRQKPFIFVQQKTPTLITSFAIL